MNPFFLRIFLVAIVLLSSVHLSNAIAASVNIDSDGVAIEARDPVAYFTENAAIRGEDNITATHEGAIYKFTSEAHKQTFVEDPEKYVPQYGGFCAYAVAKGATASVEPNKFTIVNGKLYLNYNGRVQTDWRKDIPGHIISADRNWPLLRK